MLHALGVPPLVHLGYVPEYLDPSDKNARMKAFVLISHSARSGIVFFSPPATLGFVAHLLLRTVGFALGESPMVSDGPGVLARRTNICATV